MTTLLTLPRRRPLRIAWRAGWLALVLLLAGCFTTPPQGVQAVSPFDVNRYAGQWFEIARLDHPFERGLSRVNATYELEPGGTVKVINRGYDQARQEWREAVGRARFNGPADRGSLKVSFFGPFYGGYHVIALDPDYRWSMVIGPNTDYLWILSRERTLPPDVRQKLVAKARALGVHTNALIWVDHTEAPR